MPKGTTNFPYQGRQARSTHLLVTALEACRQAGEMGFVVIDRIPHRRLLVNFRPASTARCLMRGTSTLRKT